MKNQTSGIQEQEVTYLVRRKIRRGMICTFVISLLLISCVSIAFFFMFLDTTLDMSVESIFYAHTHSIVGDIIQVKKNDFMLSQNELKIAQRLIVDIHERRNFNVRSLLGPGNDLAPFKQLTMNAYDQLEHYKKTGEDLHENQRVSWWVGPRSVDDGRFYEQIKNLLQGREVDSTYTELSLDQLEAVITCAASVFVRADYSMNFKYTDLAKEKNYIGFDNGVVCFYPNFQNVGLLAQGPGRWGCDAPFFMTNWKEEFENGKGGPAGYDPRCRPWYAAQYR
jgi:hypothetical protein